MNSEDIEKIIGASLVSNPVVRISFKSRDKINGIFIRTSDYGDLKRKNLWRIVSDRYITMYNESNNEELARIFNGVDFTRLEIL
jgi:hypothetical protein